MKPEGPQDAKHDSYVILHQGKQRLLNGTSQVQLLLFVPSEAVCSVGHKQQRRLEANFTSSSYLHNSLYNLMNEKPHRCSICDDHFAWPDYTSFLKY